MILHLLALTPPVETPPGFIRDLVESRLAAIFLGVTALVTMLLWLSWQLREIRKVDEPTRNGAED